MIRFSSVLVLATSAVAQGENWHEVLPGPPVFRLRTPEQADKLLSDDVRAAIARGQRWLAAMQHPDGMWPSADGDRNLELTAAAQLALLGSSTMRTGQHKNSVKRATKWLKDQQQIDGAFTANLEQKFRAHSMAALAMAETAAISNYKLLKKYTVKSASAIRAQPARVAGSAQGYDTLALLTCHQWAEPIPAPRLAQLIRKTRQNERPDVRDAALAILTSNLAGRRTEDDADLQFFAAILFAHAIPKRAGAGRSPRDHERDWWVGSALRLSDPTAFEHFYASRARHLTAAQIAAGDRAGSWPTRGKEGLTTEPVWQTAMAILILQIPTRYAQTPGG